MLLQRGFQTIRQNVLVALILIHSTKGVDRISDSHTGFSSPNETTTPATDLSPHGLFPKLVQPVQLTPLSPPPKRLTGLPPCGCTLELKLSKKCTTLRAHQTPHHGE